MWIEDYHWHYDYVRLAWDAGFSFEKCKFPDLDKNKICLVDIDRIIKERDVGTVDRFIPIVVQYILDSDQAKVLDTNFVKMFRISQLSVEYLLFCKQYLDNTVVLLKKEMSKLKEENKELKQFNTDLETHISCLSKNEQIVTFKCNICPKVFSSEEYLNAHVKRRHDNNNNSNIETDKLQTEIKELKERLNNTEKLLQEKNEREKQTEFKEVDENDVKLTEIQVKFDNFKEKIEGELKVLQMQKSFYEEKYGKLFDIVINKETTKPEEGTQNEQEKIVETEKVDILTQTETKQKGSPKLQMEVVQNRNVFDFKESNDSISGNLAENKSDIVQEIDSKISKFEENIESKVSFTLQNIEGQMQAFWNKLVEMETQKHMEEAKENLEEPVKPTIKPRSKFSQTSRTPNAAKIRAELDLLTKPKSTEIKVESPSTPEMKSDSEHSKTISDNIEEIDTDLESEVQKPKSTTKPSTSTLGKHSITSLKNVAENTKVKIKLSEEIDTIVKLRLQEMGISPIWKGLPKKSYDKAMEIIKHQATLTKKTIPNFNKIKQSIEASVQKKGEKNISTGKLHNKNIHTHKSLLPNQSIISIKYKEKPDKKSRIKKASPIQKVSINKSFYETDTESEILAANIMISSRNDVNPYSEVVNELKSKMDQEQKGQVENNMKGVLKNYPSIGSLTKKRVIFDVEKNSSDDSDIPAVQITGGSTTSIASSVLDKKNEKNNNGSKNTEIDNISDFDFSDL